MLSDLASTPNRREVIFFYGARTRDDLFLVTELGELAAAHDWLTFVPALSEAAAPAGTGRLA